MSRRQRYHHRDPEEDEFETPALREAVRERNPRHAAGSDDSDSEEELQSESGLGESPEEDLIEDPGRPLSEEEEEEKEDDSDSDAPEDLGFKTNQQAERKMMQSILDEIRKSRNEKKNKLRKKDELFKMQKQEKLAALNKRKLPEELLEQLAESSSKKQKTVTEKQSSGEKQQEDEKEASSSEDEEGKGEEGEGEDGDVGCGLSDDEEQSAAPGDFLPLLESQEGTKVDVACLDREKRQNNTVSHLANFKKDMLYGSRLKRITNKQARMTQAKRKARR